MTPAALRYVFKPARQPGAICENASDYAHRSVVQLKAFLAIREAAANRLTDGAIVENTGSSTAAAAPLRGFEPARPS